ncbi:DUF3658 domain-containing protein [Aquitalea denitrificans]|uniref:DUF3658 domain-containing protein n=1 Tax=Aquitalea denitrificans TaxID=519081 RepID=UPI00135BB4E0|nr:DUF3658 domain-containing protein [Aquitalea denitrificans]
MTQSTVHLLTGPAAAQALRTLLPEDEVLEVVEDFAHGPLADADAIDPQARVAWWNRIWWSMRWLPDIDEAFLKDYWHCRKQLFRVFAQRQPLCLWLGNGAHDRLLLAMVCAHAHASQPLSLVEASGKVDIQHNGHVAMGMCGQPEIQPLIGTARPVEPAERQRLAAEWEHWQQAAAGWRELHHGQLQQQPADCFDAALLEALRREGPQAAARLVGGVMGRHLTAFVPDSYLFWRLAMLAEVGLVTLTSQQDAPPYVALC